MNIHEFNIGDTVKVTNDGQKYTTHTKAYASVALLRVDDLVTVQDNVAIALRENRVLDANTGDILTVVTKLEHLGAGVVVCKRPGSDPTVLRNIVAIGARGIAKIETLTKVEAEKRLGCIISG